MAKWGDQFNCLSGHPSTWQAEVEALRRRVKELEDALTEIREIAKVSEGPAAEFYGMLADKALKREKDKTNESNETR